MVKKILQIVLALAILALVYVIYIQISTPINYEAEKKTRNAAVIDRIKDIRTAERAYKTKYMHFTDNFDSLINFVLNDSLVLERKIVDEDDSVAMAELKRLKKKNVEQFTIAVIDTIFAPKKLSVEEVKNLRYVPYTNNTVEYLLFAGQLATESKVVIPVVECRVPYKVYLDTVTYRQEIINDIDNDIHNLNKYPGIKFGSMEGGNNEAGNWED